MLSCKVCSFLLALWIPSTSTAFVNKAPTTASPFMVEQMVLRQGTIRFSTKDGQETEVERLLRKARELREQATKDEQAIHRTLVEKKEKKDAETDRMIDDLFAGGADVTSKLREKRPCLDTLYRITERLIHRELSARGLEHIESSVGGQDNVEFQRVASKKVNKEEVKRLNGWIDTLIESVGILDQEFLQKKKAKGEKYISHIDEEHWGGGKSKELLTNKVKDMRREYDEQFQNRLKEFYEAQRRKEGQKYFEENLDWSGSNDPKP